MGRRSKSALLLLLALFFSVQFYLTLFGGFLWPFSGHRLFSQLAPKQKVIVQAVLTDSEGRTYFVHPGRVIPIEYSRCSSLVRNLYASGHREKQEKLCEYALNRLNGSPWTAFDEMFSAMKPPPSAHFTALHFEHHLIEFQPVQFPDSIRLLERRRLFP